MNIQSQINSEYEKRIREVEEDAYNQIQYVQTVQP